MRLYYCAVLIISVAILLPRSAPAQGLQYPVESSDAVYDEGRDEFLVTTGLLGAIQGPLVYVAIEGEQPFSAGHALSIVGGATLGVFLPALLTRGVPVSKGEAGFTMYGSIQGFLHGGALASLVASNSSDVEDLIIVGLTSFGQATLGYFLARNLRLTPELSGMMFYHSVFGFATGYLVAEAVYPESLLFDNDYAVESAAGLAGSVLGNVAGYLLTKTGDYTRDDARVIGGFAFLGLETALAGYALAGVANDRILYSSMAAGISGGLVLGNILMDARDLSGGQGFSFNAGIIIGSMAGAAIGTGLFTAAFDDGDLAGEWRFYPLLPLAGAIAGAAITYTSLDFDSSALGAELIFWPTLITPHTVVSSVDRPLPGVQLRYSF